MIFPASLTPFSRSVVHTSLQAAHRRLARDLGVPPLPLTSADPRLLWDNGPLATLVIRVWDQPAAYVAPLLGLSPTVLGAPARGGKPGNLAKTTAAWLAETPARQERLRAWASRVQSMTWRQAQLLQVMEEIEPTVANAWGDEQRLAAAAVGNYAQLLTWLENRRGDAAQFGLDIVAGLETPDAALVQDLADDIDPAFLLQRYGHRSTCEWELATPRLAEETSWLQTFAAAKVPEIGTKWQPVNARQRRAQATEALLAQAGLLQRSSWRQAIHLTQTSLSAHAAAWDTLALVLAAVRRWALAAAAEGVRDGRLEQADEIFLLELEEIKQVLTGEWNRRQQFESLLAARQHEHNAMKGDERSPLPPTEPGSVLGIAGETATGAWRQIADAAAAAQLPSGAIAVMPETNATWSPLFLRAGGMVVIGGDWLGHAARVARAGGLPMAMISALPASATAGALLRLDPARRQVDGMA